MWCVFQLDYEKDMLCEVPIFWIKIKLTADTTPVTGIVSNIDRAIEKWYVI